MTTLTLALLAKVETLKAQYAEWIAVEADKGNDVEAEYGQYVRLTTIECYLTERAAR
jgi:hypothetical protein